MDTTHGSDDLRHLVRQALLDMLADSKNSSDAGLFEPSTPRTRPPERQVQVTLHGSERTIRLLEQVLDSGDATLEVAVGSKWGPKVRVRAERH